MLTLSLVFLSLIFFVAGIIFLIVKLISKIKSRADTEIEKGPFKGLFSISKQIIIQKNKNLLKTLYNKYIMESS